jgi:hypothetical protein
MEETDSLSEQDREMERKSIALPAWMWKRIEDAQFKNRVKTEAEIVRQIGVLILSSSRNAWDYLAALRFEQGEGGTLRAITPDGFHIRITPQNGGRWSAAAWHDADPRFDIPYPPWQHSAAAAQLAAVSGLDSLRRDNFEHYVRTVGPWLEAKKVGESDPTVKRPLSKASPSE